MDARVQTRRYRKIRPEFGQAGRSIAAISTLRDVAFESTEKSALGFATKLPATNPSTEGTRLQDVPPAFAAAARNQLGDS
jgi:hypothetical protein